MPTSVTHAEWAKALATQLIASGESPPDGLDNEQNLALAWALKDYAVAAWSSVPSEVSAAARAIKGLHTPLANASAPERTRDELAAIAAWVDGIAELIRGGMTNACEYFDRAASLFESIGEDGYAAHARIPTIMALAILSKHREALEIGQRTRESLLARGERHAAARVDLNLANLFDQLGEFDAAIQAYEDARAIFEAHDDVERTVSAMVGLADVRVSRGEYPEALTCYTQAAGIASKNELGVPLAVILESVAVVYAARGEYREALDSLKHAIDKYEALEMPQNMAMAERQLGSLYLELRLFGDSLRILDAAVGRFRSLEMPVEEAWAEIDRAKVLASLGHGESAIQDALDNAMQLFAKEGMLVGKASAALALAEYRLANGEPELALPPTKDAEEIFGENNMRLALLRTVLVQANAEIALGQLGAAKEKLERTLHDAESDSFRYVEVSARVGLGLCAANRGDVKSARDWFGSAVNVYEELRSTLPGDDLRQAYLAHHTRAYIELLRFALEAETMQGTQEAATQVFLQLEMLRARTLSDRLGINVLTKNAYLQYENDDEHRTRLNWLYRQSRKLMEEGEYNAEVEKESRDIESELLERTRRTRFSGENRLPVTSKFDANAFQRKLKTNEVLIEYGVLDDELFACVVRNDRIHVVRRVATWGRVVAAIEKAQFQLETMRYGVGALAQQADRLSQRFNEAMVQLSDLLWTPFVPLLKECKRIAVVPHAVLGEVQFAALFENGRVLGEKYEIAIAPSARAISYAIDNPPIAPRNILALAENTYLDEAENEAAEIAQLFTSAEVLVNERATSAELKRLSSKADVLHIACHASFRSDNPTFSSLHLADAPFSARDAESLSLERCLVTLSACETGRFQESRGDEMMGIVRGFLVAGATCVVASLWSVDDAVTRGFMTTFYRELISGANPARALQEAQATIRATHPHPFYWGAFSLFGGW